MIYYCETYKITFTTTLTCEARKERVTAYLRKTPWAKSQYTNYAVAMENCAKCEGATELPASPSLSPMLPSQFVQYLKAPPTTGKDERG